MRSASIVQGTTEHVLDLHPAVQNTAVQYTAKLQQAQKGERPICLLVDPESGHLDSEMETIYMYKFAPWQTDIRIFK
ncbi:MAG: hypothetical protein WAR80_11440 [Ferruginibacter sp.]